MRISSQLRVPCPASACHLLSFLWTDLQYATKPLSFKPKSVVQSILLPLRLNAMVHRNVGGTSPSRLLSVHSPCVRRRTTATASTPGKHPLNAVQLVMELPRTFSLGHQYVTPSALDDRILTLLTGSMVSRHCRAFSLVAASIFLCQLSR